VPVVSDRVRGHGKTPGVTADRRIPVHAPPTHPRVEPAFRPESTTEPPLRLAHFVPVLDHAGSYGGPAAVCEIMCDELAGRGHSVTIVGMRSTAAQPWVPDGARRWDLRIFPGRAVPAPRSPGALVSPGVAWWFLCYGRRLDCLHLHGVREPMSAVLMLLCVVTRTRYVVQAHGMLEAPRWIPLWDTLCGALLRRAHRVFALTPAEARSLADRRACSEVAVMANPAPPPTTTAVRHDYVLACSRVHPRKRLGLFAAMAEHLHDSHPELRFVVVGPPEGDEEVVQQAMRRHPGSFAWIGGVPGPAARRWISDAAVLVVTAENEPFGMTIVEALAAGTPVLGTWDLALASALSTAGAMVAVEADPVVLAEALVRMLTDEERVAAQVAAGREWLAENASAARAADTIIAAYSAEDRIA
jgi:glycosyltransferase involved in cell wall biosynthesis